FCSALHRRRRSGPVMTSNLAIAHRTVSSTSANTVTCTSAYQPDPPPLCKAAFTGRVRREGAGCGNPGSLRLRRLDPLGDELVKAMGMTGISKSQVSRLCSEIDDKIAAFLNRPLEGDWPYLWLDATYLKVRASGRIVSVAVIVAVAVSSDGRREVLGITIGASEAETFWTEFLRSLARRGLRGVKLVISDAHEGLKAAVAKVLHASWQRCRVHFMRNVLAHAGKQGRRVVAAFIATAFAQEDAEMARLQWRQVADQLRPKVAKLATLMDQAEADVLAFMRSYFWSTRLQVEARIIRVQRMTRKWGSCSTTGTITLADDLASEAAGFQDFVIVHELLHLRVPNHSRLFKALLTAYVPNWRRLHPNGSESRTISVAVDSHRLNRKRRSLAG